MEIADIKNNIDAIKKSRELWYEFQYSEPDNYAKRHALAIELQYNDISNDMELIRFLMENEVKSRENDPYQGIGDSLILISYLLSKFKNPENVWLFEKAKCANFDTYCGYDSEFMFSAGVEATCKYLESCQLTESNKYLYERKDNLRDIFTEDHINKFIDRMRRRYPDNIKDETTKSLLCRAIEFDDFVEGERLFRLFEKENSDDINSLYYYAKNIKNYDKAIYYQTKLLKQAKNIRDKVSSLHNIASIYCLKNDFVSAYKTAKKWNNKLIWFQDWKETGLGRTLTETWFDICIGFCQQNQNKLSLHCFANGEKMIKRIKWTTYVIYEKALECSEKLGLPEKEDYYRRLKLEERKRIDAELNK